MQQVLLQNIDNVISSLLKTISSQYDIDLDDLTKLWTTESTKSVKPKPANKPKSNSSSKESSEELVGGCPYILTRGKRKGEQCHGKSAKTSTYCAAHKKYEGMPVKAPPKVMPKVDVTEQTLAHPYHDVLGVHYHIDTKMVFESENSFVVTGKIVDNEVHELTEQDKRVCERFGFEYN